MRPGEAARTRPGLAAAVRMRLGPAEAPHTRLVLAVAAAWRGAPGPVAAAAPLLAVRAGRRQRRLTLLQRKRPPIRLDVQKSCFSSDISPSPRTGQSGRPRPAKHPFRPG